MRSYFPPAGGRNPGREWWACHDPEGQSPVARVKDSGEAQNTAWRDGGARQNHLVRVLLGVCPSILKGTVGTWRDHKGKEVHVLNM